MAIYAYIWLYMLIYGHIYDYMWLYAYILYFRCLGLYLGVWTCIWVSGLVIWVSTHHPVVYVLAAGAFFSSGK